MKFNNFIIKEYLNDYGGSEKKRKIEMKDGLYLLKLPDPTREEKRELSYINNALSEYVGCKIAKSLGFPVQEVIIGEYDTFDSQKQPVTKIGCACKDFGADYGKLIDADKIQTSILDRENRVTFETAEDIINYAGINIEEGRKYYAELFILDAFIANKDRHHGNWGLIEKDGIYSLAPVYDCGSSLSPLLNDEEIQDFKLVEIDTMGVTSAIRDDNDNRLNYISYLKSDVNHYVTDALKRIICNINLSEIHHIIDNSDCLTPDRKNFYNFIIDTRYDKVILSAFKELTNVKQKSIPFSEMQSVYQQVSQKIKDTPLGSRNTLDYNGKTMEFLHNKSNSALIIIDNQAEYYISLRSNDKDRLKTGYIVSKLSKDGFLEKENAIKNGKGEITEKNTRSTDDIR